MNTQGSTYLTINDFTALVIAFFGVVALVFLIILLVKLISVADKIKKILSDNGENIAKTVKTLPDTAQKVNTLVTNLDKTVEHVMPGVNEVSDALGEAAATVKSINTGIGGLGSSIGNTFGIIVQIWGWLSQKFKKENNASRTDSENHGQED